MQISPAWSEGETLFFLRRHFPFLKRYADAVFDGVDGRVLLGVTDANASRIFGDVFTERDLGLLLAKINFFRSLPSTLAPDELPAEGPGSPIGSGALSPGRHSPGEAPSTSPREIAPAGLPSGAALPSPTRTKPIKAEAEGDNEPRGRTSVREFEPSILIEVWSEGERFQGEAWLPAISELCTKEKVEHKVQLRRTFSAAEVARAPLLAPKPFLFGSLKIRARYARNFVISDCRHETSGGTLFLTLLECLMYRGAISDSSLKFKLHVLPPSLVSEQLRLVYESQAAEVTDSLCLWHEDLELRFLGLDDWRRKLSNVSPDDALVSIPPSTVSPAVVAEHSVGNVSSKSSKDGTEGVSVDLETLRSWAVRDEWFMFQPRYSRYDAEFFPIHEPTSLTGDTHMLRSPEAALSLRKSPGFMARFKEAVSLVLLSWGFDMDAPSGDSGRGWQGHSWRLRHLLLSCILLDFRAGVRSLAGVVGTLKRKRRVFLEETGETEAIFTLGEEQGRIWFRKNSATTFTTTWPKRFTSLDDLLKFSIKLG